MQYQYVHAKDHPLGVEAIGCTGMHLCLVVEACSLAKALQLADELMAK
jgi:hypothetical protein